MKQRSTKLAFVSALLIIPVFLSGCLSQNQFNDISPTPTLKRDILDGGFLSGEPCSAPCFLKIIPGVTDEKQAIEILSQYFSDQDCQPWDRTNEGGTRGIGCHSLPVNDQYLVGMDFNEKDRVDQVSFIPTQIFTVGDVIEKHSQPNGVDVISWTEAGEEPRKVFMALYYNELNSKIVLPIQEGETYTVLASTPVESISYVNEIWWSLSDIKPWIGYGDYPRNVP